MLHMDVVVYKFNKVISKDVLDLDMPQSQAEVLDETSKAGKKKVAAKNHNEVAMVNLVMVFMSETMMGLVYKATTTEWPSRLAHLVVKGLFKKYQPQDMVMLVELRQMLNKIMMKKGLDPATLFEQIAAVENHYNTATKKIAQDELIVEWQLALNLSSLHETHSSRINWQSWDLQFW